MTTRFSNSAFNVLKSIQLHVNQLKPYVPKQAILCSGEYSTKILIKWALSNKMNGVLPVFIDKSSADVAEWTENRLNSYNIIGLNREVATHFWFDSFSLATENNLLPSQLKDKTLHKLQNAILVSAAWEGFSSGLTPALISQLNQWNVNNLAIAIFPSKSQPPDAHFNALSSIGKSLLQNTALLLIERDRLERYVGVNRNGSIMRGNILINDVLDIMLSKEDFVDEVVQLSKSHKVKKFTILPIMGASLEIYGSLENMLDSALLKQLLTFDLSTATVAYIILRLPLRFKDKIRKESFELTASKWLKKKAKVRFIYIAEPIYVKDLSDRIDIIMLIGGIKTNLFESLIKEVDETKNYAIEQKRMKKEEWNKIVESLAGR